MRKFRPLALALALVGSVLLVSTGTNPASAATTTYQAENAARTQGVVESNHAGFTGTGFVNYDNVTGSSVTFTVNVGDRRQRLAGVPVTPTAPP